MDKALKIYEKVQKLDGEIIKLEKLAMQLANDETEVSIDFKVLNLTKKKEDEDKIGFDEDGSLKKMQERHTFLLSSLYFQPFSTTPETKKVSTDIYNHSISSYTALNICGMLLQDKLSKREKLIEKLKSIGVKIN